MRVISFIEVPKAIDKIIHHFKLSIQAERPPTPPQIVQQDLLMTAEEGEEYF